MMSEYNQIFVISGITCDMSRRTSAVAIQSSSVDNLGLIVQCPAPGLTTSHDHFYSDQGLLKWGGESRVREDTGNTGLRRRLAPARPGHNEELGK